MKVHSSVKAHIKNIKALPFNESLMDFNGGMKNNDKVTIN